MKKTLPIFSYLFHPIFIVIYATLLYFLFKENTFSIREAIFILSQVLIITVIIPTLFFIFLRSTGNVNSIMNNEISQRKIPLIFHCFLLILLIKRSIVINLYPELHFFILGILFSTIACLILLFFKTKASIYVMSISALSIFIIAMSLYLQITNIYWSATAILITGLVASSRLVINAHTNKELVIGLILGISPQILFTYLWL